MKPDSTHWTAVVMSMAWGAFFVALIFRPALVRDHPVLAFVAVGGCLWWMVKAHRTRRREKARLPDHEDPGP